MAELACSQCGAVVPENHQFCGSCGASARVAGGFSDSGDVTDFFSILQTPGRAKLIVIAGEGGEGVSYALNATEHTAGRNSGVILFPDDTKLSNEHATFFYRDGQLHLKDVESLNGTFLRLREAQRVVDGTVFSCGRHVFRVDVCSAQSEFEQEDGTLLYVSPNRRPKLQVVEILEGGKLGAVASSSSGELTIGRESCDLSIANDGHLSRRHCRLSLERDGRVLIADLASKNGTFLRINGEMRLQHGDYVSIGSELLRVEIIE